MAAAGYGLSRSKMAGEIKAQGQGELAAGVKPCVLVKRRCPVHTGRGRVVIEDILGRPEGVKAFSWCAIDEGGRGRADTGTSTKPSLKYGEVIPHKGG